MSQLVLENHLHAYKKSNLPAIKVLDRTEKIQNEPPQNAPLGCMDYATLKAMGAQKTQEELFTSLLTVWKNLDRWPGPGRGPSPERTGVIRGGQLHGASVLSHLCAHWLCMAWQTFVYQTLALPIFLWIVSLPFEAPDPCSILLSSIEKNWVEVIEVSIAWELQGLRVSHCLCGAPVRMHLNLFFSH